MRDAVTTALEVIGLLILSIGFGLAWLPLGLIAGGGSMVLVGFKAA